VSASSLDVLPERGHIFHGCRLREQGFQTGPIRTIFKEAFAAIGLPYFNPHCFSKMLALLGGELRKAPEQ
jgi:hypothetical protein